MRGFTALPYKSGENQTLVYNTRNMNAHTDAQKKYKALETEKVGRDGIKIRLRPSSSATKFTLSKGTYAPTDAKITLANKSNA